MVAAKESFDADPSVAVLLESYNDTQEELAAHYQTKPGDESGAEALNMRINQIYRTIMDSPANRRFEETRTAVEEILRRVDAVIISQITGEEPSCGSGGGCGGGGCGGCGKH